MYYYTIHSALYNDISNTDKKKHRTLTSVLCFCNMVLTTAFFALMPASLSCFRSCSLALTTRRKMDTHSLTEKEKLAKVTPQLSLQAVDGSKQQRKQDSRRCEVGMNKREDGVGGRQIGTGRSLEDVLLDTGKRANSKDELLQK